jgi:hypothetical protein
MAEYIYERVRKLVNNQNGEVLELSLNIHSNKEDCNQTINEENLLSQNLQDHTK